MGNQSKRLQGAGEGGQNPGQSSILEILEVKYKEQGKQFLRAQSSYQKAKKVLTKSIDKDGVITQQRRSDLQYLERCVIRLQNHYINQVAQVQKLIPKILERFKQMYKQQPEKWTGFEKAKAELQAVVCAVKCSYEKEFMKLYEKPISLISKTTIPEYELLSYQKKQEVLHEFDQKYPPVFVETFEEEEIYAFEDILKKTQLQSFLRKSEFAITLKFRQMKQLVHARCYDCCVFLN